MQPLRKNISNKKKSPAKANNPYATLYLKLNFNFNSEEIKRGGTAPFKTREEANEQLAIYGNKYSCQANIDAMPSI